MGGRKSDSSKKISQTNRGVLQHHFRYCQGINGNFDKQTERQATPDEGDEDNFGPGRSFWTTDQKKKLISSVLGVVVPTGVTHIPKGLGTSKNGELKASEWHALFAIYLPFATMCVFIESAAINKCLAKNEDTIENFTAVVCCTNILSSDKVHDKEIGNFTVEYSKYNATAANIFSNIKILPNHHYAPHIPDQMRQWRSV
ncbi:hypothetical protein VP01_3443g2 [Puccinia sorghi]|uniref:Uncharacterized protein n=1 Tax=Puccinia sorghi TaxID=27349 RepID=A0A0L6UW77_9BASI|nr:hypothetical protein VP01_3443g2 [Puccinia sorghi]